MKGTRLFITAQNQKWAHVAANELCGYATSVIACDVEAAIECELLESETPDGRPGVAVMVFAFDRVSLEKALQGRVGQCVLTCPTTACFSGYDDCEKDKKISIGGGIRFFGDGLQSSKKLGPKRFWRIPVMDGEFLCEDKFGTFTGIGGGNLLICGRNGACTLAATEAAADAIRTCRNVIMPFPGGIVRSGSKVGSQYPKLKASTNEAYCPTVRALAASEIPEDCQAVYEIVIDGLDFDSIQTAMKVGLHAAARCEGILKITAGNYGGKLGKHHFHLRELL